MHCDQIAGHPNSVNTIDFLGFCFCFIVFISRRHFACLRWEYVHPYCKECMCRQLYLFVCYGIQELHRAMDGKGSDCIEKGLHNGRSKRGGMKEVI